MGILSWDNSPELLQIFRTEIDERSARLRQAGLELSTGQLPGENLVDLIRDAHTLKGSSHMMGRSDLGDIAALLERAWREVEERQMMVTADLGMVLAEVAERIKVAVEEPSTLSSLDATVDRLRNWVDGDTNPTSGNMDPATDPAPAAPSPVAHESRFGGLLGSIDDNLSSAVTRVDTHDLYLLINRTVELQNETDAIADLSYVSIAAADPAKLQLAWRQQLTRLSVEAAELRDLAVGLANVRFGEGVGTFPQLAKFLGRRLDRQVELEISGGDIQVDRQIVDLLREPLRHLIVNAVDHGIEPAGQRAMAGKAPIGRILVAARLSEGRLLVEVTDDGRGVDWVTIERLASERGLGTAPSELESHLFKAGFSTVTTPNDFSGAGEGLASVADCVDRVGGSVSVVSHPEVGTSVRVDVPASMVLQRVAIFGASDQFFGLAESAIIEELASAEVRYGDSGREVVWQRESIPLISLTETMSLPIEREPTILIINSRSGRYALSVSEVVGHRPVAVKGLGPILDDASHLVGAAFLGAGEVLVILDHHYLGLHARMAERFDGVKPRILVVDDSAGVRQLMAVTLRGKGFDVVAVSEASDAVIEIEKRSFDLLVVDYLMPRSNGVELVKALRGDGVRVPIVMVSGVADAGEKASAWESGVDAYLDKYDLRSGALIRTINRLLEERPSRVN